MLQSDRKLSLRALRELPTLKEGDCIEVRYRGAFGFAAGIEKVAFQCITKHGIESRGIHAPPSIFCQLDLGVVKCRKVQ